MTFPNAIGLALGSGGARGFAHLGVLRALREAGLEPGLVAGCSMGALVGLGAATGQVEDMIRFAQELDWRKALRYFVEARLPKSGLLDGGRVMEFIGRYCRGRRIEDLPMPYAAVATDLAKGAEAVLDTGPADEAVRASIAIPGLFTPVKRGRRYLVDGGLVNPVPVNVARRMGAAFVVAVDVTHFDPQSLDGERPPRLLDVMGLSMRIMESRIAGMRLEQEAPDFLIRPDLGNIYFLDFHRAAEVVEKGYKAGCAAVPALRERLAAAAPG